MKIWHPIVWPNMQVAMKRNPILTTGVPIFILFAIANLLVYLCYDYSGKAIVVNNEKICRHLLAEKQEQRKSVHTKPTVFIAPNVSEPNLRSCGLTLFTSAPGHSRRPTVYENTIDNWSLLRKWNVTLIFFTDDNYLCDKAKRAGWLCFPVLRRAGTDRRPVLTTMFLQAMLTRKSCLYGFANADILFDESLAYSLESILSNQMLSDTSDGHPLFVTSRRTRVKNVTRNDAVDLVALRKKHKEKGVTDTEWAEDVFITSSNFPWITLPDIVIGLASYDNWLVLRANELSKRTIDIFETTMVVHQSTETDDLDRVRLDDFYNRRLITNTYGAYNDQRGRLICTYFISQRKPNGEIIFTKRIRDVLCTDQ